MTHGIVTAPQPEAVEVGSLILRDGGADPGRDGMVLIV